MVTQAEMLKEHVLQGVSRKELVNKYDTNMDRVRGTLSKAWDNNEAVSDVLKTALSEFKGQEQYRLSQRRILAHSAHKLDIFQQVLATNQGTKLAVFASDQHLPYLRMDYFNLLLQILEFFSNDIAYYSALNDFFDFPNYGRWEQLPNEHHDKFTSDIENIYKLLGIVTQAVKR